MPFTLSHPAVVIPLKRFKPSWFSGIGLISGSIAPDFEYFMALKLKNQLIVDFFLVHLPVAIFLSAISVLVVPIFPKYLPVTLSQKYQFLNTVSFSSFKGKALFILLTSAAAGILSHLLLDELFHPDGITLGINKEWLNEKVLQDLYPISRFLLIERFISLIFLAVVINYLFNPGKEDKFIIKTNTVSSGNKWIFWGSIGGLWVILSGLKMDIDTPIHLNDVAVTVTSAGLLSTFIVSLVFRFLPSNHKSRH